MSRWMQVLLACAGLAAGGGAAYYFWLRLPEPASAPIAWNKSRRSVTNWTTYLMKVDSAGPTGRPAPAVVWKEAVQGLADDPESLRLLRRLYDDLPVTLAVVADPAAAADRAYGAPGPPDGRSGVALFLNAAQPGQVNAGDYLVSTLNVGRVQWVDPTERKPASLDAVLAAEADDLQAVLLVMNDHLLRQQTGWWACDGNAYTAANVPVPKGAAAELQAELDRQVEQYCRRHAPPASPK